MKDKLYKYEILELLKKNEFLKQREIQELLFIKGIITDFRTIRASIEDLRKKHVYKKDGEIHFIVSGNFGYSLQPAGSELFKEFIRVHQSKIKSMTETLSFMKVA